MPPAPGSQCRQDLLPVASIQHRQLIAWVGHGFLTVRSLTGIFLLGVRPSGDILIGGGVIADLCNRSPDALPPAASTWSLASLAAMRPEIAPRSEPAMVASSSHSAGGSPDIGQRGLAAPAIMTFRLAVSRGQSIHG